MIQTIKMNISFSGRHFDRQVTILRFFDTGTIDVIAPYGEGKQIILDCGSDLAKYNPNYLQSCLKKAKPYTVSLFRYQVEQLLEKRGLIPLYGGAYALDGYYDEKTGFSMVKPSLDFLEV